MRRFIITVLMALVLVPSAHALSPGTQPGLEIPFAEGLQELAETVKSYVPVFAGGLAGVGGAGWAMAALAGTSVPIILAGTVVTFLVVGGLTYLVVKAMMNSKPDEVVASNSNSRLSLLDIDGAAPAYSTDS